MSAAFKSILPPNATYMERALEATIARTTDLDVAIGTLWNLDQMPSHLKPILLPYLAWSLGVEIWSDEMTIMQKEQMIRDYLVIRALRGTKAAIEKTYQALNVAVEIIENPVSKRYPKGEPFKFKLKISSQPIPLELKEEIRRLTDLLKPLRTNYFIDIEVTFLSNIALAMTGRITSVARFLGAVNYA